MSNNINNMKNASKNKKDEFYTQIEDIETELKYYKEQFKNKIVFCNCDDPYESNFFKYFALNFNTLGLKKLITTCYAGSPIVSEQLSLFDVKGVVINTENERIPYKIEITEVNDENKDGAIDLTDVEYLLKNKKNTLSILKGNGDFRSEECIKLLKQADIVVTNPPFSLFREYVAQLMEFKKKFLIIGNQNAITYKEIFPLIKENKMWLGVTMNGSNRYFRVPDYYELTESTGKVVNGVKYAFVKSVVWFTNMDNKKRNEEIILYKKYNSTEYPKYDNYNAINVNKVSDIPIDYFDDIGVPITFLHKYNPSQFIIKGLTTSGNNIENDLRTKIYTNAIQHDKNGKEKSGNKVNDGPCLLHTEKPKGIYYTADNVKGYLEIIYARIIIQRKKGEYK